MGIQKNPDVFPLDKCHVAIPGVSSGFPLEKRFCLQTVVNVEYHLCEKHSAERARLVALFGEG